MKTYPLRTFVGRVLLLRVAVAGLVLCAVAAVVAWRTERGRMEDRIVDTARVGVARLASWAAERARGGEEPTLALREAVARAADAPVQLESGRFVALQVFDASGKVVAEARQAGNRALPRIDAFLAAEPPAVAAAGFQARTVDVGEGWHVLASAPLADAQGPVRFHVRGLFAVSEEGAARARETALRAALLAALVVLIVTAVLYPVVRQLAVRLADYSTALLDANLETLSVLGSAIAKRDSDTDAHNYRVTLYSARLGEAAGVDAASLRALLMGAFLHDVGKIGIPDAILLKPGKLDDQEFAAMKSHVDLGVDIVSRSTWLAEAIRVVGNHHEKYMGNGYPSGAKASDIPVEARIFAIADVFDALTSERPYKAPFTLEKALAIMDEGSGSHFDPALASLFRGMAPDLYRRYAGKGRDELAPELEEIVRARFSPAGMALPFG